MKWRHWNEGICDGFCGGHFWQPPVQWFSVGGLTPTRAAACLLQIVSRRPSQVAFRTKPAQQPNERIKWQQTQPLHDCSQQSQTAFSTKSTQGPNTRFNEWRRGEVLLELRVENVMVHFSKANTSFQMNEARRAWRKKNLSNTESVCWTKHQNIKCKKCHCCTFALNFVRSAAHGLSIKAPPFKLAPVSAVFVRPNLSPQVTTVSESLAATECKINLGAAQGASRSCWSIVVMKLAALHITMSPWQGMQIGQRSKRDIIFPLVQTELVLFFHRQNLPKKLALNLCFWVASVSNHCFFALNTCVQKASFWNAWVKHNFCGTSTPF